MLASSVKSHTCLHSYVVGATTGGDMVTFNTTSVSRSNLPMKVVDSAVIANEENEAVSAIR